MRRAKDVPGPGAGTKARILDAAEALLSEHGYEGTSLRAVTQAAGVNLAAVNYHFGSKRDLLEAVVRRAAGPVNQRRLEMLEAVEQSSEGPAVETVIRAFLEPVYRHLHDPGDRGRTVYQLLSRVINDPDPEVQNMLAAAFGEVGRRFTVVLGELLPHLSPEELWWRFKSCVGVAIFHQSNSMSVGSPEGATNMSGERSLEMTLAFTVAGMRAPATP